ncbi:hypothetical protein ACM914_002443 [Cronobacter dublinensis]
MSAKDDFLKKMEANQSAAQADDNAIKSKVVEFQRETDLLFETIKSWLRDTGIQGEITQKTLTVESSPVTYKISVLKLTNGSKTLQFMPEGLFYMFGVTGSIQVALSTPGSHKTIFELHMKNTRANCDGWVIAKSSSDLTPFNEDNFFNAIGAFA